MSSFGGSDPMVAACINSDRSRANSLATAGLPTKITSLAEENKDPGSPKNPASPPLSPAAGEAGAGEGEGMMYRLPPTVRFRRSEELEQFLENEPVFGDGLGDEDEDEEKFSWRWRRWSTARLVESVPGRGIIIVLIMLNAILVGMFANQTVSKSTYDMLDWVFTFVFCVEICLKLFSYYHIFFNDPWNNYDFVIVAFSVFEKIVTSFDLDATVARIIRVLRVFRFFRVITAFQSLNKITVALWESMKEVGWVFFLAILLIYMTAVISTTAIGQDPAAQRADATMTAAQFSSVERSMLTLLRIMTLDDWSAMAFTYMDQAPGAACLIVLYMIAAALILMNLLSAIFVDKLMKLTKEEDVRKGEKEEAKRRNFASKLRQVFETFDEDGNGVLTENELRSGLQFLDKRTDGTMDGFVKHDDLAKAFGEVGLEQQDLDDLLGYLADVEDSGDMSEGIDYDAFILGIFSMGKPTTQKDALEIMSEIRNLPLRIQEKLQAAAGEGGQSSSAVLSDRPGESGGAGLAARLGQLEQKVSQLSDQLDEKTDQILALLREKGQ